MDIDFDELRSTVAMKHGVLLDQNDPILVTVTLNEAILNHFVTLVEERQHEMSRELTAALHTHTAQSKELAGTIITESANYVKSEVLKAVETAQINTNKTLEKQIVRNKAVEKTILNARDDIKKAKIIAITASIIAGISAITAIVVVSML